MASKRELEQQVGEFKQAWAKERSPEVLMVLSDFLLQAGIDPEPVIEELKLEADQDIRRMKMEWLVGEVGNLETGPLHVQELTMDAPPTAFVEVPISSPHGPATAKVSVPADALARIQSVHYPSGERHTPRGRNAYRGTDETWLEFAAQVPFEIDERDVLRRAGQIASQDESQVPWVGLEGELFYPSGEPHNTWLWLAFAPEYLQRELEREFPDSDFITRYTDGGGFQSDAVPAFVRENDTLYQLVRDGAHTPEVECPLKDWDDENREDARDRLVTDHDTLFGEDPHKRCRFCEAEIGEEHGVIYTGEGGEYVYASVPDARDDEDADGE